MTWKAVRVGDISEQIRGVTYSKEEAETQPGEGLVPILRANNITDSGLMFEDLVYVPERRVRPKQHLMRSDVVIAASSGSLGVVGKAAPVTCAFDGSFGAFCKVLRPSDDVHPSFFAHFFKTRDYRRKISALAAGININNLRGEHLDELELPLPPIEEQRRIADILDKADALRTKRREAIARLDTLAQSIFIEMFGDALREPPCWPMEQLGNELDFLTSGSRGWASYYREEGSLFLRIQNVRSDKLLLEDVAYVEAPATAEARRTRVKPGDVLLSITADLGRTAVVPSDIGEAYINQHLAILRPKGIEPRYLSAALASPFGQMQIARKNRQGVKAGLNFDDIRSLPLVVPPRKLQQEFEARIGQVEVLEDSFADSAQRLDSLFASLQHRAFRGEL